MITIEQQLKNSFDLKNPVCKNLNTPTNDVIEVTTSDGHYALKLYNTASRKAKDVYIFIFYNIIDKSKIREIHGYSTNLLL